MDADWLQNVIDQLLPDISEIDGSQINIDGIMSMLMDTGIDFEALSAEELLLLFEVAGIDPESFSISTSPTITEPTSAPHDTLEKNNNNNDNNQKKTEINKVTESKTSVIPIIVPVSFHKEESKQTVNTDGGAYVAGNVRSESDFIGRDKSEHNQSEV